jgi:hypothetical protein
MGHNKIKWNISLEEGQIIAHSTIIEILRGKPQPVLLNELISLLNAKTKKYNVHKNKKYNCFSKYFKMNYGELVNFLDSYNIYGIINSESSDKVMVILLEEIIQEEGSPLKSIIKDSEWIFI